MISRIGLKWCRSLVLFLLFFGVSSSAFGEIRVLFVGNSYTGANNLKAVVGNIAMSHNPPVEIVAHVTWSGGATLWDHKNNAALLNQITTGNYDFVVLQDQSQRPWYNCPGTTTDATALDAVITASGAKTVMFMTWGRASGDPTIAPLAACYTSVANLLGAELAPVGLAWDKSLTDNPGIALHTWDGSHPNEHGTYLAACVFFSIFTGHDPIGLSNGGLTGVSASEAAALQTTAWDLLVADFGYPVLPVSDGPGVLVLLAVLMMICGGVGVWRTQRVRVVVRSDWGD